MNNIKKCIYSAVLALAFCTPVNAQDCGSIIDTAGVLNATKLQSSISAFENAGAEVHYYTANDMGNSPNMDILARSLEQQCPSWQGSNGGRKNNLILFAVATQAHKVGVYYGASFHKTFDDHFMEIQADMKPKFRDGDFTGGFVAGSSTALGYIKATNNITLGKTTVVNQQATDYSGLWRFFMWLLFVSVLALGGWFVYYFVQRNRANVLAKLTAQRSARSKKARAVTAVAYLVNSTTRDNQSAADKVQASLDQITYSSKYDVESDLEVEDYQLIGSMYDGIYNAAILAGNPKPKSTSVFPGNLDFSKAVRGKYAGKVNDSPVDNIQHGAKTKTTSPSSTTQTTNSTTYVDRSYDRPYYDLYPVVIPVVIEEPVYREPYRAPDPDPSYSRSSSSDDSSSGGSSSWSSDDSSSSYGGSDSFSSSDSGGGGSNDW